MESCRQFQRVTWLNGYPTCYVTASSNDNKELAILQHQLSRMLFICCSGAPQAPALCHTATASTWLELHVYLPVPLSLSGNFSTQVLSHIDTQEMRARRQTKDNFSNMFVHQMQGLLEMCTP